MQTMRQRLFGLIGKKLDHSFSMGYFAEKFRKEGIEDARYEAFPLERISAFTELLKEQPKLVGLNVTIPYKEEVIPYLDELSDRARSIGAVNTIRLSKGIKEGFNTDADGFREDLHPILPRNGKKAMILGTGGASRAVQYVLEELGYGIRFVSRDPKGPNTLSYSDLDRDLIADQDLIVNTTPVGTWPDIEAAPPLPYDGIKAGTVLYDLIYNPQRTRFLQEGEAQGATVRNGYGMLVEQAEAAWRIWNEAG
jgi:shikimate dehydrogenase